MKLAMRLAAKPRQADNDRDPREGESAEIIDLASRAAYPAVTQRKGKSDALGLAAGVAVVALLGMATLWGLNSGRTADREPAASQAPQQAAASLPQPPLAPVGSPSVVDPMPSSPPPSPLAPVVAVAPQARPLPAARPYPSSTVIFDSSALPESVASAAAPSAPPGEAPKAAAIGDFAARIGGVGGGPATAATNFDPTTTITQGTMIPAILETAINTDVPGYARAVVSQDVRSFDGSRVLVPRSSRLIGQYQSGVQGGQKRAYVIWTRLIRPDGVSVDLASPATGFDGSTGLEGKVNSHFFQRFGSAMLLSVVGGLSAIGTGGASLILGGGQSAAATAVQQGGTIAPTIRVRQGEPIRVFTARDLDFSRAPRL
uniref:TrbI/VirB10 family protein n=1 Tax=Altererythrobacter segetis TaxID=1104773 RepID=UPI00140A8871|nr:TrbI/VirB10 family protein [Altererythrobacter segetis]